MWQALHWRGAWLAAGLLMVGGLLAALLWPDHTDRETIPHADKYQHVVAFAFLTLWFAGILRRRAYLALALVMVLFAASTEWLQEALAPTRSGDWHDFQADTVGVMAGLALAFTPVGRWCALIESQLRPGDKQQGNSHD